MTDDTRTVQKNLQYHFVVLWDEESSTWSVDGQTLDAEFGTGVIFDTHSQTWVSYEDDDDLRAEFLDKENALATLLQDFNNALNEEDK